MAEKTKDKIAFYQIRYGEKYDRLRYKHYEELVAVGDKPRRENYDRVYICQLKPQETPYQVYQRFISQLPRGFRGHAVGVSDVIIARVNGVTSAYYIDLGTLIVLPGGFLGHKKQTTPGKERGVQTVAERRWVKDTLTANKKEIERIDAEKKAAAEKAKQQQMEEQEQSENQNEKKKGKDGMEI